MIGKPVTVSAIMPTYNAAPYLAAAIESIRQQTYTDWELIIIDDGSTDATPAILAQYRDPRIITERIEANQGRGVARNMALQRCRGRYIAICDSDDMSLPGRFARQVEVLTQRPDIDVVSGQVAYFWGDEPPETRLLYPEDPAVIQARFARGRMAVSHAAAMIRATCFQRFGLYATECHRAQDLEFFLRIRHACSFMTLPDRLVLYRHERRIPFTKWLENAWYTRYAAYHAAAGRAGSHATILTFQQFSQLWATRLRVYTIDILRFLNFQLRTYIGTQRILR
ncbi:MAG TPA: glycosyltransferase family 2 protein [Roseiflexaceae bacterium]|nr:glycosyltransferase family 2 protein [Roseiflexaceae bacterium]HMP39509.1 glycosyltransferase family 2 protein [Roseiflexaceae bacterium]